MALLDDPLRDVAEALIDTFGADATLVKRNTDYSPETGTRPVRASDRWSVKIVPPDVMKRDKSGTLVASRGFETYIAAQALQTAASVAPVPLYAATLPNTAFLGLPPVPLDMTDEVTIVYFAHGGDVNRAVTPEDPTAYYSLPGANSVLAFENLADIAAAGSGYIAWESEAGSSAAPGLRYALFGDGVSTAGSWVEDEVECRRRIDYHASVLTLWRARQPSLKIGLEHGLPALPAVSRTLVQSGGTYYAQYQALLDYEQAALAHLVDYLIVMAFLDPDLDLVEWRADVDFFAAVIAERYPDKPVQLMVNHNPANVEEYVGDAAFRYMAETAADLGWSLQFWRADPVLPGLDEAWAVLRTYDEQATTVEVEPTVGMLLEYRGTTYKVVDLKALGGDSTIVYWVKCGV